MEETMIVTPAFSAWDLCRLCVLAKLPSWEYCIAGMAGIGATSAINIAIFHVVLTIFALW